MNFLMRATGPGIGRGIRASEGVEMLNENTFYNFLGESVAVGGANSSR